MIERTVLEIARHRFWAWQRRTAVTPRTQLRETDQLLSVLEECRLRRMRQVPTPVWREIVHLLGQIDPRYTQRIGIDRSVELSSEVLFEAQGALMDEEQKRRRQLAGKIVPLFRHQTS